MMFSMVTDCFGGATEQVTTTSSSLEILMQSSGVTVEGIDNKQHESQYCRSYSPDVTSNFIIKHTFGLKVTCTYTCIFPLAVLDITKMYN